MSLKNGAQNVKRGGFWESTKNTYSPETQKLLKEMMQEAKLTCYQQRRLQQSVQSGDGLPLRWTPNASELKKQDSQSNVKSRSKKVKLLDGGKRSKETIALMGSYDQSTYRPSPVRRCYNKEKQKLANIMAYGKDNEMQKINPIPKVKEPEEEIDRFEELQNEIDERHAFLQEMEALGKAKKYRSIIQTEISQKIHEMEIIDKQKTHELEKLRQEKKQNLRMPENSPISEDSKES